MSVFISYRRDGGSHLAGRIYDILTDDGYDVFYDVESMQSGLFTKQITLRIFEADDFLLIVTKGMFDRCNNQDDFVRREIEEAIRLNKNIVLAFSTDFVVPDAFALPKSISNILSYQGVKMYPDLFNESVRKLEKYLETKPTQPDIIIEDEPKEESYKGVPDVMVHLDLHHLAIANAYHEINGTICPEELKGKFLANIFPSVDKVEPGYFPYLDITIANISSTPLMITNHSKMLEGHGDFNFNGIRTTTMSVGFDLEENPAILLPGKSYHYSMCGTDLLMLLHCIYVKKFNYFSISVNGKEVVFELDNFVQFNNYFNTSIKKDFDALLREDYLYRIKYL